MSPPAPPAPKRDDTVVIAVVIALIAVVVVPMVIVVVAMVAGAAFFVAARPAPAPPVVPASNQGVTALLSDSVTTVLSTPEGARVIRNGVYQCTTPCLVFSDPADTTLSLELQLEGHETYILTAQAGSTNGVTMTPRMP